MYRCTVYCFQKRVLGYEYWQNVTFSDFALRASDFQEKHQSKKYEKKGFIPQSQFNADDHWIAFEGLEKYHHTVWGHEVLDINGKFLLKEIDDHSTESRLDKDECYIKYIFEHEHNDQLLCIWEGKGDMSHWTVGYWKISIEHQGLGPLVGIDGPMDSYQNVFSDGTEVIMRFSSTPKSYYWLKKFTEFLITALTLYQGVVDVMYIIEYLTDPSSEDTTKWHWWTCAGFIASNSANMKRCIIFILCLLFNGDSFVSSKGWLGKLLFWMLGGYLGAMIPVGLCYVVPFVVTYIWLFIPWACFVFFIIGPQLERGHFLGESAALIAFGLSGYFLVFLWPVGCMSRLYAGESYMMSLWSLWSERETEDLIEHWFSQYHNVAQLLAWIL